MRTPLMLLVMALSGCVLRVGPGLPPPQGHPAVAVRSAPGPMSRDEAIAYGNQDCAQRGYACRLDSVKLKGNRTWKLAYVTRAQGAKGRLKLEYDVHSRQRVKQQEKWKGEKDRDDDDDD